MKIIELTFGHFRTFTDFPCESLHTQKTKQFYFKPEQDFWIVMVGNPGKLSSPFYLKIVELLRR